MKCHKHIPTILHMENSNVYTEGTVNHLQIGSNRHNYEC